MASVTYDSATRRYAGSDRPAVDALDLEVADGEFLVLVGPSGCGKSTSLRMLAGLEDVDEGAIRIGGRDVTDVAAKDRDIAMVFQNYALYPHMTVGDNIGFPLKLSGVDPVPRGEQVGNVASALGIGDVLGRRPSQLSGGQRQRVAIARALVSRPEIVICDEPTSALDVSVQSQILNLLMDLRRDLGLTYVFISHNLAVVEHIATRVAVMYLGRMVETARTDALFARPRHPYTRALLDSVLTPEPGLGVPDPGLGAVPPDPLNPPPGCRFHPRCPRAFAPCPVHDPVLRPDGEAEVACHLYDPAFAREAEAV